MKKVFFMTLRSIFKVFWGKYCAVSENIFSMSVIPLHFSHCKFSLFCEFIELSSKLGLQRAQFWSWLPVWQNPQNLRAWYILLQQERGGRKVIMNLKHSPYYLCEWGKIPFNSRTFKAKQLYQVIYWFQTKNFFFLILR